MHHAGLPVSAALRAAAVAWLRQDLSVDCRLLAVTGKGMCDTGDEASKQHHLHAAFIDEASGL